ncbi:MAG: hypothetical protein ACFFCO_12415 [Promethearchaeota archaeon]
MTRPVVPAPEFCRILSEVLERLHPHQTPTQPSRTERVQQLLPLLEFLYRRHWRTGFTEESEAVLKRFAYKYLTGKIPSFE